jgi:signal transduction histidine kinase/PAS domain-containing protein
MLPNFLNAFRSSPPVSPKAVADIATLGTSVAARQLKVPIAILVHGNRDAEGAQDVAIQQGQGAERIARIPPLLLQVLDDANGFTPFVLRDTHRGNRWKGHHLASAIANIVFNDDSNELARFAAAAPLRLKPLDKNAGAGVSEIQSRQSAGALLLLDTSPHPDWTDEDTATLCDLADLLGQVLLPEQQISSTPEENPTIDENLTPTEQAGTTATIDAPKGETAEQALPDTDAALARANEALRDSERLFRAVMQGASDAIVLCDGNARIVVWNKGASRMFGFTEEAVLGRPLWDLLSRSTGGRRAELERLCRDEVRRLSGDRTNGERDNDASLVASRAVPLAPFEALGRRATGGEFPIEMLLNPWQGEQKLYINAIIRDVSARQQAEGLRALSHAVSRILAEAPTLDEAGHSILRSLGESHAWSMGGLWLIQRGTWSPGSQGAGAPTGPVLRLIQAWNQSSSDLREVDTIRRQNAYACGVGLPGRVWAAGEPFWVEDLTRDPHTPRASALTHAGFRTAMGFPIRFGHEILGVIDLYSTEVFAPDSNFLEMASAFGNQIGQFIARKQVEQEIRVRARQQATVARLGQRALSRAGIELLLNEAVALVSSTLAVDGCAILELLPDGKVLRTRTNIGNKPGVLGEIGVAADATTQSGWTLLAGEPVIVNDYRTENRFAAPLLEASGAISGVSVVIPGSEKPFGVLLAHAAHERIFAPDDVHFLEAVANVVAAAMERYQGEKALEASNQAEERARVQAEAAQRDAELARVEAERANKAKSEFLSRMSHELRTPLNAILGFCQLLEMEELTPDQNEFVRQVGQGGAHLLNLINEVLEIARIEAGRLSLSLEAVSPGLSVRQAMELVAPLAVKRGITMRQIESDHWNQELYADRGRLHEILLNYLSNAVKYNREGGQISISCLPGDEGFLRLSVADTGNGIAPDYLPRLFHAFDRLDADSTSIEGTGLGLALVRNLAEAMGGRVGVHSETGRGSVFWTELPLWHGGSEILTEAHEMITERSPVPLAALSGTVLSIEDNHANRQLIEGVLSRYPQIEVVSAVTGQQGLEVARRTGPDVILLDLDLPDIHGFDVLKQLTKDPGLRLVPVVIVSADATQTVQQQAQTLGAFAYLTKPLEVRALVDVLGEALPPLR